ncbi:FAD-dependent oxidoreductase [Roseibacillus persicicus]|uniref:Protein-xanthan lyase n=1 Tax=Roseibacillus persicicus TaxID=454148 RepID=A0A918WFG0_9BACT|nr:FAD-dependent oxidoreductase [Roseibacillus persicicus]GHC42066.1 protein-xanthan lyase [Roseibacillus persicicus]
MPFKPIASLLFLFGGPTLAETHQADLIVYGGTSTAVMASVQASQMGKSVIMVSPDKHLGGLSSGGLGWTDNGHAAGIGGLSREFYQRIKAYYDNPEAWRQQTQQEFRAIPRSQSRNRPGDDAMWIFEPHVAEKTFDQYVTENKVTVVRDAWLDRENGVEKDGPRIVSITTLDGEKYVGEVFIDATYEGDLMAAAGVSYHVGREANSVYNETINGVQKGRRDHPHHFDITGLKISPYKVPGDPESGLLPRISAEDPGEDGSGDHRIQAYCFRACLTNDPDNRIPFPKPENYDPEQYEVLLRVLQAGWPEFFRKFDPAPNKKTDQNNHGPFSTDNIGKNYDYPEASYERRREIIKEHEDYQKGLMYFVANDPRVPKDVQDELKQWGLPKDEFVDNGHWSHQLYIREARRMIGEHVVTEHDVNGLTDITDSIGMGVYTMDSHNTQRYITPEGYLENEGNVGSHIRKPYPIAFGSILPKKEECTNLLVPGAISSSHIAFGSLRMEPTFMILGQSAGTAASFAIEQDIPVQEVDYEKDLRPRLLADKQRLESGRKLKGLIFDDKVAELTGEWVPSSKVGAKVGSSYLHDKGARDGKSSAVYQVTVPAAGKYEVQVSYSASSNRASKVPVTISHAAGLSEVFVNQQKTGEIEGLFTTVGQYSFEKSGTVSITNQGVDGHVVIDAVRLLKK